MKYVITLAVAAASLGACAPSDSGMQSFFSEAGAQLDSGDFGEATMSNTMVQSGERQFAIDLTRRFAAEVDTTVTFAFNSSVLDANARQVLTRQADWIRQFPEVRFKVFGHTDLVGSASYNRRLGLRRAQAVVAFMTTQGIDRSRLEAVSSFGETQPIVVTEGRERRNRRTVTEVSGLVENSPLLLNGKYAEVIFREYIVSAVPPTGERPTQITTGTGG